MQLSRRFCILPVLGLCSLWAQPPAATPAKPAPKPKLVLMIAIDQFRYDYLTRYRAEYTGGFDRLLKNGANFVNAHLEHFPSVTAVGHSTMMTGAIPAISGIVENSWYDRDAGKSVTSVSDDTVQILGSDEKAAASPRRLLVSTVGDELKRARRNGVKVIGISLKDRSAILPSGHMANGAFWYDSRSGNVVSSTYYFPELPEWVKKFNAKGVVNGFAGKEWRYGKGPDEVTKMPSEPGAKLAGAVYSSPFGNELVEMLAEEAIVAEKLGQRDTTDVLTMSFSSNDSVGHAVGPDSPQAHDISVKTDQQIAKLFRFLDQKVGMDKVLVVLTADHGVMPVAEQLRDDKMPGGRLTESASKVIESGLTARFGAGKWVLGGSDASIYLNLDLIREKKLDRSEVERAAAASIERGEHVARVYTRTQLLNGQVSSDFVSQRVLRGFNPRRSGDVVIVREPYFLGGKSGTSHGTPYLYDTHIPLIFMGPGVRPGRYARPVAQNDLAPTLATILDVETPSGAVGRALYEAIAGSADR